jgi:hypothetical protein
LTAVAPGKRTIAVGVRLGVVVTVRVPGRTLRRLAVVAARSGGRHLSVTVANRGDIVETITAASLHIALVRGRRTLARFSGPRRQLLPHSRAVLSFRVPHLHGRVEVRITLTQPNGATSARRFPLRL